MGKREHRIHISDCSFVGPAKAPLEYACPRSVLLSSSVCTDELDMLPTFCLPPLPQIIPRAFSTIQEIELIGTESDLAPTGGVDQGWHRLSESPIHYKAAKSKNGGRRLQGTRRWEESLIIRIKPEAASAWRGKRGETCPGAHRC